MASTNKTPNYDLSQYIGTDKPTYLGDYNSDMLKIDTAMRENADGISEANTNAGSAVATAKQAQQTAGQAKDEVSALSKVVDNQANSISTATTTANNALTTANRANENASSALTATANTQSDVNELKNPILTGAVTLGGVANNGHIFAAYDKTTKMLYINGEAPISGATVGLNTLFTLPANIVAALGLTNERTIYNACGYIDTAGTSYANGVLTVGGAYQVRLNANVSYVYINDAIYTGNWN